jgi:sulfite reductase alpha subunit-like flavoprotein
LLEQYPLPHGTEPIPDHVLLEPKWLLEIAEGSKQHQEAEAKKIAHNGTEVPPEDLLDVTGGLTADIAFNHRLTPASHWQDVRQLGIDIPNYHPYVPGDVLTIYPKNFPADVDDLLSVMKWTSIADSPLRFTPSSLAVPPTSRFPVPHVTSMTPLTLRILLTNHLDIMSIPRRSFFAQLAHFTSDELQKDRLLEFTNPEYIDELYDYTSRPRRSILEVLQEFETVKIPWQRLCSIIPAIRGRQYSIASALDPTAEAEKRTRIELLVAVVKYKTVIKRIRQGVCTRYVASLRPGQRITVTLQKGGLGVTKAETERPVVMVGPGTGVAPMRALTYQRKFWRKESQPGNLEAQDMLFFGCRSAESDYFFKDEWAQLQEEGVRLDVFTAFSRDQVGY